MKHLLFICLFLAPTTTALCTTWIISNSGFQFDPMNITIAEGDDVVFDLDGVHNAVEVSMATWNSNGNTPLSGGFAVGFGGGPVSAEMLPVGTHYFVCQPHSGMGMKGTIIVEASTSTDSPRPSPAITLYPNPATTGDQVEVKIAAHDLQANYDLALYDLQGQLLYFNSNTTPGDQRSHLLQLSHLPKGMYILRIRDENGFHSRRLVLQ
jgi:plastocyanin